MGININAGDLSIGLAPEGDLAKLLQPGLDLILHFDERVKAICAVPETTLEHVPEGSISATFSLSKTATWNLPEAAISLTCRPESTGTIRFTKSGTLFDYLDGDEKPFGLTVPDGSVYVTAEFQVSFEIAAGAAFSSQGFGVKGSLSHEDCFTIANHRCFPATCKVVDALREVFGRFTLPFQPKGVLALGDEDLLDFQFLGKLELGFGLTYGFEGALLCGRSAGEISRSFLNNKLATATLQASPSFAAAAKFAVTYDHEDAFRFVFGRLPGSGLDTTTLTIMRMDKSELATKFTAGITLSAGLEVDVKTDLKQAVGDALGHVSKNVDQADSGPVAEKLKEKLSGGGSAAFQKLVDAANGSVNALLGKASGKVGLELLHERATTNTALFQLTFDLSDQVSAEGAIRLALQGRIAEAATVPGVAMAPGSLMEREFRRRTAFTFQFFDLWKWQQAEEYIENVDIIYAGNNTLRWIATSGVTHSSGIVGHEASCDLFFRAEALEAASTGSVDNLSVALHFELVDKNRKDLKATAKAITALGTGGLEEAAAALAHLAAAPNPSVKTICIFPERAFGGLNVDDYIGKNPPPLPHQKDATNYAVFAAAVREVDGQWVGFASYADWATFNRAAVDGDESRMIPDRRNRGNVNHWPSAFAHPSESSERIRCAFYSDSARAFMNVCEDLRQLHEHLDAASTEAAFKQFLKEMNDIVHEVPPSFIKATLVALVRLMGLGVQDIAVKARDQAVDVSFRVMGAEKPAGIAARAT